MFDAAAFAAMKPGAVFCNVARGSLVDEAALIDALERGHLGAAILDVARTEPLPPDDPLWDAPNIYISPHSSTSQDRYLETLFDLFADNLGRYARGDDLRNVVDLSAGLLTPWVATASKSSTPTGTAASRSTGAVASPTGSARRWSSTCGP